MMTLYSYFRSSTAYRARIALNVKRINYKIIPVDIVKGEQRSDEYRAINPLMGVPALNHDGFMLGQSLAIIDYLDQVSPENPLVFGTPQEQGYIRQICQAIACDIHPLTNLRVMQVLRNNFGADDGVCNDWYTRWAVAGVSAVETMLRQGKRTGKFALGDRVSAADVCIVPQMYGLRRYKIDTSAYPLCSMIEANCVALDSFKNAAPEMQPDAPDDLAPIHGPHFCAA